jgi:hypothetical protein
VNTTDEFKTTIYINGTPHRATDLDLLIFYVDHPSLPGRRCARHTLDRASLYHLRRGGDVFTAGNRYSLVQDEETDLFEIPHITFVRYIWRLVRKLFNRKH